MEIWLSAKHAEILSVEEARLIAADYVTHYNEVWLHSAIGYVTPHTKLAGKDRDVFAARDQKLEPAREQCRQRRQQQQAA